MDSEPDILLLALVLRAMETWEKGDHTDDASGWVPDRSENQQTLLP